ncbi:cytokine inducing-glycoprotein [Gigaspora margarita]|uniref:Cytokine inducing-glycoprotein n=1 Tax=Gigaspora margarita TaxID=4874 RepID=A0A8H4ENY8_GIGMA|nr:cytokine inducing-glycoprotein [Gigaspora margarita]
MKSIIFGIIFAFSLLNLVNAHYRLLTPRPRGDTSCDIIGPCGNKSQTINATTISSFPIKGYSTLRHTHTVNGTLYYLYSKDGGNTFSPVAEPIWYNVTNHAGENLTTFVDLTKAGATVGTQGILQSYWIHGNDTSPQNTTWYQCADIKIVDDLTSANSSANSSNKPSNAYSINAPHVGFTLFISLFLLYVCLRI